MKPVNRFDALGDDVQIQDFGERDDRADDLAFLRAVVHPADECASSGFCSFGSSFNETLFEQVVGDDLAPESFSRGGADGSIKLNE
jgi:hypothetical protein